MHNRKHKHPVWFISLLITILQGCDPSQGTKEIDPGALPEEVEQVTDENELEEEQVENKPELENQLEVEPLLCSYEEVEDQVNFKITVNLEKIIDLHFLTHNLTAIDDLPETLEQGEHHFSLTRVDPDQESSFVMASDDKDSLRCDKMIKPQGEWEAVYDQMRTDALRYGAISIHDYNQYKFHKIVPVLDKNKRLLAEVHETHYKEFDIGG